MVYDGYPQLETLEYLGIDNSKQVKYLLDNNFTIYNGVFSFENSTLGTMGGLFQGETKYYGQNNTRLITGGYSTLVEKLIENNYVAFGIFSNSFYLPPNEVPNYKKYFPAEAKRGKKIFTSMLRGKQTFRDLIFSSSYDDYLNEKHKFLNNLKENEYPSFLYSQSYYPGHTQNSGECLEQEFDEWKNNDLITANNEMKGDISALGPELKNSIVIITGDHGPYLTKNCTTLKKYPSDEVNRYDIQDRYGTFLAIHVPKNLKQIDFEVKNLQNLFLYVLSSISNSTGLLDNLNEENINNSVLPDDITVLNNIVFGGIDDGKYLFDDRSLIKNDR